MIFKKNEYINETLDKHFETWSHTLDTADFVPRKYLKKIDKVIFNQKLKIWLSGLEPLYLSEKQVSMTKPKKRSGVVKEKAESEANK